MVQADLHLDTPTQVVRKQVGLGDDVLEASLGRMRAGGTNLATMVLWPPQKVAGGWEAHVERLLAAMETQDAALAEVELVRSPEQARASIAAGRVAMLYALEGAHGIDKLGVEGLRRLHARGLALLGLTWSFSNRFAGSSADGGGGLTPAGEELVDAAQRMGVLVDVSHASKATTLEVCARAKAPVIASHSDAGAVHAHARNLSDEEIACIARTGGVIGLNLHRPFLGKPGDVTAIAAHAEHLRAVGGVGVVALGSDFDGMITPPVGLPHAGHLGQVWEELHRRGWSDEEIRGVRGENFLRAWSAALGGASP